MGWGARGPKARRVLPSGVSRASGTAAPPSRPRPPPQGARCACERSTAPGIVGYAWDGMRVPDGFTRDLWTRLRWRGSHRGPADSARRSGGGEGRTRDLRTASRGRTEHLLGVGGPLGTCRRRPGRTGWGTRSRRRGVCRFVCARGRAKRGRRARRGKEGVRKEAAAARRRVIYTFKTKPPAPRWGDLGSVRPHARDTSAPRSQARTACHLLAPCAPLSLGPRRPGTRTLANRSAAQRPGPSRGCIGLPPTPVPLSAPPAARGDSEESRGEWMRARWTAAHCSGPRPPCLVSPAAAPLGGDPHPHHCCAAAGGDGPAHRRPGAARRPWRGAMSASATA